MPELPEVEVARRVLLGELRGARVGDLEVFPRKRNGLPPDAREQLRGRGLRDIRRYGKLLAFDFDRERFLLLHLMLIGHFALFDPGDDVDRDRARLLLSFEDARRLGLLYVSLGFQRLLPAGALADAPGVARLGPDPLNDDLAAGWLRDRIGRTRRPLKTVLLDGSTVAGMGNRYADEACFRAGLHPARPAESLGGAAWDRLEWAIPAVVREVIAWYEASGAMPPSLEWGDRRRDSATSVLRVVGRAGATCIRCGAQVVKVKVAGRGTYLCPSCQPEFE
jgi:formamidopyrimidine-DNA glycosylase